MKNFINGFYTAYCKSAINLEYFLAPIFALMLRYIIFKDFIVSGWMKLNYLMHGQFSTVIDLYKEEYHTPVLSPELAAYFATFTGIIFPVLIMIGLFTRFSAIVILFMTAIIEFTYMHSQSHVIWVICSGYLAIYGAGKISLDYILNNACQNNKK